MNSHGGENLVYLLEETASLIKDEESFRRNFKLVKSNVEIFAKIFGLDKRENLETISVNKKDSPLNLLSECRMTMIIPLMAFLDDIKGFKNYKKYLSNKSYYKLLFDMALFFREEYKVNGAPIWQTYELY